MRRERIGSLLYRKIVICIAVALLVPLVLIYTFSSLSNMRTRNIEYMNEAAQKSQTIVSSLENELDRFMMLSGGMGELAWLREAASSYPLYSEPYEISVIEQNKVKALMKAFKLQSQWLPYIGVLLEEKNTVISSQLWGDPKYFFSYVVPTKNPEKVIAYIENVSGFTACSLKSMDVGAEGDWLLMAMPIHLYTNKPVTLFQCINPVYLDSYIKKLNVPGVTSIRVMNNLGETIYTYSLSGASGGERLFSFQSWAQNVNVSFYVEVKGEYISICEQVFSTLSGVLLMAMASLIVSLLITEVVYAPILRIRQYIENSIQRKEQASFLNVLLTGEEFQVIEQKILEMNQNQQAALYALNGYREKFRTNFLRNLLKGYFDRDDELEKHMKELKIVFSDSDDYIVYIMTPIDVDMIDGLMFAAQMWISENQLNAEQCRMGNSIAIIFCLDSKNDETALRKKFEVFYSELNEKMVHSPVVSQGKVKPGYEGICESYRYAIGKDEQGIDEIDPTQTEDIDEGWKAKLTSAIYARNADMAKEVLAELSMTQQALLDRLHLQLKVFEVVLHAAKADPQDEELLHSFVKSVAASDEESWDVLEKIVVKAAAYRTENEEENGTGSEVIRYIDEHYADSDLSLKALSGIFNFSVSQISKTVKQTVNMGFLEYLHTLRITKAKALMREGMEDLKEIGERVGFDNNATFVRVFVKLEQMTPRKYLDTIQKSR